MGIFVYPHYRICSFNRLVAEARKLSKVVGKLGFICAPPQRDESDDRVVCLLANGG